MYAVSGILFNHQSQRRGRQFVTRKITLGIKDIINGVSSHIELGNLDEINEIKMDILADVKSTTPFRITTLSTVEPYKTLLNLS